ncbi:hypothetical protein CYMTET_31164 [Cymbomonas tetramitiformis]|uniref:Thioredoxin domain-containing protein n=1 Tax=Cymbomonas tetramitiformis TaxID=36881 RepID=A0AAE0FHI0_9CHLO|nr:hypothetical protein CYMTET_31164 [Cymbomonas tetramitiformis]
MKVISLNAGHGKALRLQSKTYSYAAKLGSKGSRDLTPARALTLDSPIPLSPDDEATTSEVTADPLMQIHSLEEFHAIVASNPDKLVLLDCAKKLCGPCELILPVLRKMARRYCDVTFLKVDIEENDSTKTLATNLGVRALPSMYIFRGEQLVASCRGAREQALTNQLIENLRPGEAGYMLPCFRRSKLRRRC